MHPLEIDVWVEIHTINEVNLNKEYLDATIYLDMIWKDRRLEWNRENFGGIHRLRVGHEQE